MNEETSSSIGTVNAAVMACLAEHYGITGSLRRLPGENLNFLIESENGLRYVAKIVDEHMPPAVVAMEHAAIEHAVSTAFPLRLPRIIPNINKKIETCITLPIIGFDRLRIMDFIAGTILEDMSDISTDLLKNIGISVARFNLSMLGFEHPAASRNHRWNLARTDQHRDKIALVGDMEKRALLTWAFDVRETVQTRLDSLPQQFIHGDLNRENILVDGDVVTGLLDFGDCCLNPTVCDLAICLTYLMMDRDDPLETAAIVTGAYHAARPLSDAERAVLFALICGRLATTIAIAESRRSLDPQHPHWFSAQGSAWELLGRLRVVAKDQPLL